MPGLNEFWCPVSGMYFFMHASVSFGDSRAIAEIWMDDEPIITVLTSHAQSVGMTNAAMVHCQSGSKVYVQCEQQFPCVPYGSTDGFGNSVTFTGFLLFGDD